MQTTRLFLLIAMIGVGCQAPAKSSPPRELKMTNLMKRALAEGLAPGIEVIVSLVEIPPHTTLPRHWHPGEEFHYYLDGEATIDLDGKRDIVAKRGGVGHVPFKNVHTAITGDKGVRVLVVRVHEKGKPVRYLTEGGAADK